MYVYLCVICVKFIVAAQEGPGLGPGIVIVHPDGQDVTLLCNVTENLSNLMEGWKVNNMGPYGINAIRGSILVGYTAPVDGGDLIVENITVNDARNGTEYVCVIYEVPLVDVPASQVNITDLSEPTYLYVAGE